MALIINNAADSRKLSEANDPTRHFMNEFFKKISTAIDQAVAKGRFCRANEFLFDKVWL